MKKLIQITQNATYGVDFDLLLELSMVNGRPVFTVDEQTDLRNMKNHVNNILNLEMVKKHTNAQVGKDRLERVELAIEELPILKNRMKLARKLNNAVAAEHLAKSAPSKEERASFPLAT